MMLTTREHVATCIREAKPLAGFRFRAERGEAVSDGQRVRREASAEELERVKAELGDAAAASRVVPYVWSTERRADDGHIIKAQPNAGGRGWVLDRFRKSPGVFFNHRTWMPRIGDALAYVDGDKLRALVSFFPRDLDPVSWSLGEIAATRGYAASVQWDTNVAVPAPDDVRRGLPWALDILEATLFEGSLVGIGSDEDALAAGRAAGLDVSPIARALEQAIDEARARGDTSALERMLKAVKPEPSTIVVDQAPPPIPVSQVVAELAAAFGGQLPKA